MKKTDEIVLEGKIREDPDRNIYEILEVIGMHPKRAAYILLKWSKKGRWNYGINVMHGWFEDSKFAAKTPKEYFDPEYAKAVIEAMDSPDPKVIELEGVTVEIIRDGEWKTELPEDLGDPTVPSGFVDWGSIDPIDEIHDEFKPEAEKEKDKKLLAKVDKMVEDIKKHQEEQE